MAHPNVSRLPVLVVLIMAAALGLAIGSERPGVRNGRIAFADAPGRTAGPTSLPHAQIYTIDPDGKDRLQLTTGPAGNFFPAWSPDGQHLAFTSIRNGRGRDEIWVINAGGKGERRLTGGILPAWSPEGRRLAFFRPVDSGHSQIWVIEVDGRDERQLTTSGNDRGFGQVRVMNAYGSKPHALTVPW